MVKRSIEQLNLLDDFLFQAVISRGEEGAEVCRILLNTILGKNITRVRVIPQKPFLGMDAARHGIRLDAYVEDISPDARGKGETEADTELLEAEAEVESDIYDLEVNKRLERKSLPKRSRYYHALIDSKILDAGKDYKHLRRVVIIMILPYDPFGKNRMVYTVRNSCVEDPSIPYDDGAEKIFLYTGGNADSAGQSLKEMLEYMQESDETHVTNPDIEKIHDVVSKVRCDKEVGISYMKSWEIEQMIREEATEEGYASGMEAGMEQALRESILDFLREHGTVPEELRVAVQEEKNLERLRQWNKMAARAATMEEFAQALHEK